MNILLKISLIGIFFITNTATTAKGDSFSLPVVGENLCHMGQIEIASCMLEGEVRDIVSICANKVRNEVYYYFGKKDKIELNFKFSYDLKIFRWLNPDTHAVFFGFNRDGHSYILEIPQETLGARATLYVKSEDILFDYDSPRRRCTNNSFGEMNFISNAIENVNESSTRVEGLLFPPN